MTQNNIHALSLNSCWLEVQVGSAPNDDIRELARLCLVWESIGKLTLHSLRLGQDQLWGGPHLQNEKCCVEPSCSKLHWVLPPQFSLSTLWGSCGYTAPLWFQDNLPFLISTEKSVISLESLWPVITLIQTLSISREAYGWGYGLRIER